MPTIRRYFYRSVKNIALIVATIIALIVAVFIIGWVSPFKEINNFLFYSLYFTKEIISNIAVLICAFWAWKAYKIYRTEASFGQELIKMSPTVIMWLVIFGFGAVALDRLLDNTDCQNYNYNDKLNGGVKEFDGKQYTINICGSGVNRSHFFGDGMDRVQLTITDPQGQLLAKRRYKVLWDGQPGHEPITIDDDKITYQDDDPQESHTITMPPTFFDWLRARLPFSG